MFWFWWGLSRFCCSLVSDSGDWFSEVPCISSGREEIIWVSHESEFELGIFFLSMSSLSSLGLVVGGGPVSLVYFPTVSKYWSPP